MRAAACATLALVAWGSLAGCTREPGRLQVVSAGAVASDRLTLWVANESIHHQSCRPRIGRAEVWVDGAKADIVPRVEAFNSKYGWSEAATFAVPESARTARIEARVTSGDTRCLVAQDWGRRPGPLGGTEEWVGTNESITLISDEAK